MKKKTRGFDTEQVHAGQRPDPLTGARAVPIFQTTSYVFKNCEEAEARFNMSTPGDIYTRISNPTTAVFEERMAVLEKGSAALALASGSAAVAYALMNLAQAGDEIVAAETLYGGSYNLLAHTLPRYGIRTHFVDPDKIGNFHAVVNEKTKAIFIESLGNPGINIVDFDALSAFARSCGIPLVVDNTFATPYLFRPFEHGANVVVHSATKFIGGHGTSLGGVIVDGGNFDWSSGKFPGFTDCDPGNHGAPFADLGNIAFVTRIRAELLRDLGAALSPFNAWLFLQGLETLSLRVQKHVSNAERVAGFLEEHPAVEKVNYPGLKSNRYHALKERYFPRGAGSIFTVSLRSILQGVRKFIDSLELFSLLANVADAKSLVIHPATTTHQQMQPEARLKAGAGPETIRLSVGLEDPADLVADLERALNKI
ncbi:MAG: O-acetylhomoserine aminocarboxypropyltransferase/cysteine synthase [bacterium]|jgi:O-acetylhomoserine (thiol)-lyase|nr:O-acetylhomoserine aminocarboxypropyltransferase/cysteine synthase [bacterium]